MSAAAVEQQGVKFHTIIYRNLEKTEHGSGLALQRGVQHGVGIPILVP